MIIHNLLKKHQMMKIIEWSRSGSFIQLKQERTKKKTVLIDLRQPDRIIYPPSQPQSVILFSRDPIPVNEPL